MKPARVSLAAATAAIVLIAGCAGPRGSDAARGRAGTGASGRSAAGLPVADLRTSCRSVVYVGDLTSEGMMSSRYLPDPAQHLDAQDRDVGVQAVTASIVSTNTVAQALAVTAGGYQAAGRLAAGAQGADRDCWVVALGTNDTADVAAGSGTGRLARIREMMSAARGRPVLWVNVISLLSAGPYSEANMQRWNQALREACPGYPNMRIFDWAGVVRMRWFLNDGIRYTSDGYASRARQIAKALARAFPARGHSTGCTVT